MSLELEKENILGVKFNTSKRNAIIQYISDGIKKKEKIRIVTPNPEMVVLAQKDEEFKEILNSSEISICDGIGIIWASKILGKNIREKITGIGLMEDLCKIAVKNSWTVFLLGGQDRVGEKTKKTLEGKYPGIRILGAIDGSPEYKDDLEVRRKIRNLIRKKKVDLLFVAYGAPKQEKWMFRNLDNLPVTVAMGVGGSFDYIAKKVRRAPKWMRRLGFEWLFRLITEPWRLKRQLRLIEFVRLVVKSRMKL